jgi:hypothetical protein
MHEQDVEAPVEPVQPEPGQPDPAEPTLPDPQPEVPAEPGEGEQEDVGNPEE